MTRLAVTLLLLLSRPAYAEGEVPAAVAVAAVASMAYAAVDAVVNSTDDDD